MGEARRDAAGDSIVGEFAKIVQDVRAWLPDHCERADSSRAAGWGSRFASCDCRVGKRCKRSGQDVYAHRIVRCASARGTFDAVAGPEGVQCRSVDPQWSGLRRGITEVIGGRTGRPCLDRRAGDDHGGGGCHDAGDGGRRNPGASGPLWTVRDEYESRTGPGRERLSSRQDGTFGLKQGQDVKESGMRVEIFSDMVCPWCFIGKRRWEQAIETAGYANHVQVTWRPFQLNPTMPKSGMDRRTY